MFTDQLKVIIGRFIGHVENENWKMMIGLTKRNYALCTWVPGPLRKALYPRFRHTDDINELNYFL